MPEGVEFPAEMICPAQNQPGIVRIGSLRGLGFRIPKADINNSD
jgi:hypothetical protein